MQSDDLDSNGRPASSRQLPPGEPAALTARDKNEYSKDNLIQIPSIQQPKGGGALKSVDEKFEVNSANGTASCSFTIPMSKSRGSFGPALSLDYNSGSGNSPFGLGWNIGLTSIRRRTDKLLPHYRDADNSDVFQLTGMEDLVPKLIQNSQGDWLPDQFTAGHYQVKRFRPRIEAAFTLVEQVISPAGMYWKTTTKENVVTFYGLSASARVADPKDPTRIFEWWPELSFDDKGSCFQCFYVPEDLRNVPSLLHEGNRLNGNQPVSNIYLKRMVYGNTTMYSPTPSGGTPDPYLPVIPDGTGYLFQLVLDYGDHDPDNPTPLPSGIWGCRLDAFSNNKPGFDWRTYRLCRRFLLFHQFAELDANPVMVKSLDLAYQFYDFKPISDPYTLQFVEADLIASITETGWSGNSGSGYQRQSYPPITFTYQLPVWNTAIASIGASHRMNIPQGLIPPYQFTDLYDEGISGILSEQSEGWYYNSNLGSGSFTPANLIAPKPSFSGLSGGGLQLQSLTGDGRKFIVSTVPPNLGFFELTSGGKWLPFQAFEQYPGLNTSDPNVKYLDLNGDGMPEIVLSEEQVFTWYPASGMTGYDSPELAPKPFDEEVGPAIVFADPVESIFLADMNGDGLTDIVRIRNGEISYWPNQGYGIFGAKVNMTNAPVFDNIDSFNPLYLQLADINGTGVTDLLYLGKDKLRAWLNLSGNAWGQPFEAPAFPHTASPNQLSVADLLGNGTACIVWSSPLPSNADSPILYIDLMGGRKPYLMNGYANGMGKEVSLAYKSSTSYYLQDKLAGTPWITQLCFPVQCVDMVVVTDSVSGTKYSSSYTYHHGYYDHPEKEYRGFGRVEQTDTDVFDTNSAADQAPMLTRTWFHTGVYFGSNSILHQFAAEYFQNPVFAEYILPEPVLPAGLTADEAREAARACKGMILRQEVYALDASLHPTLATFPYSAAEHNNMILLLQPQAMNPYAAYLSVESENISYNYERIPADPRIAHSLNTAFDPYGNIIDAYSVAYPRQPVNPADPGGVPLPGNQPLPAQVMTEQQKTYIIYTHHAYTSQIITAATYRLPAGCESITWQWTGAAPAAGYYSIRDFTHPSTPPSLVRLKQQRTLFLRDDLVTPLPLYTMDTLGLPYQQYHLAIDAGVTALSGKTTTAILQSAAYIESDAYKSLNYFPSTDASGEWWVPAGTLQYLDKGVAQPFFQPYQYLDAYGYATTVGFDKYWLLMQSASDPMSNTMSIAAFDYRVLQPGTVLDPNNNATDFRYDILGHAVAIAMRGKGEGDIFDAGFTADLTPAQIQGFFDDPITNGPALLQGATMRYIYAFPSPSDPTLPFSAGSVSRQFHANTPNDPRITIPGTPYQFAFEYTDGLGRMAMKKVQADPYTGSSTAGACDGGDPPAHRWIGKGKTVYNNKGKEVMQYEPYFSDTPSYEQAPANGVTAVLQYDPPGRVIRTDYPDGSFSMTSFDAWVQIVYDQNDTVEDGSWYPTHLSSPDPKMVDAANKAAAHYNTPTANHLDPLGRNFYTVAFNIVSGVNTFYAVQTILDVESNPLQVIDARGNMVVQQDFDRLNRAVHQVAMDTGERWIFQDSMNKALLQWDSNSGHDFVFSNVYDKSHRLLQSNVQVDGTPYLFAYNVFGEGITIGGHTDTDNNLRGQLYRAFDQTGLTTRYYYDFKGNLLQSSRIFAGTYRNTDPLKPAVAWTGAWSTDDPLLEKDEYISLTQYDALNRPQLQVRPFLPVTPGVIIPLPYNQAAVNSSDVIVQGYGESGALNTVDLYEGGGTTPTGFVSRICHNEKGQRLCIQTGNNTVTRYTYDPDTFRLTRLLTTAAKGATLLQDLNYYYDPAGNVTYLLDNAQPPVFYNNQKVLSDGNYTYDAVYRLIKAMGREQVGQNTPDESSANTNYRDYPFDSAPVPAPTDAQAMRSYTENYQYDAVGCMTQLQHVATGGSYTRTFAYNNNAADRAAFGVPSSQPENNQVLATTLGANPPERYNFDSHGNLLHIPPLPAMAWNYQDQLVSATQQAVGGSGVGQTTYYIYDSAGNRTRKVTEGAAAGGHAPLRVAERRYIAGFEIYRTYDGAGNTTLERQTLHITDDAGRIALVDKKTIDTGHADPATLNTYYPRYQYSNVLNSVMIELDANANTITYEEYHPFGTTSYQAADAALDVPAKRYRYSGKERDEESGLYYYGARYYAPWLCCWTSADPAGLRDGLNLYQYTHSNPIRLTDPTGTEGAEGGVDDQSHVITIAEVTIYGDPNDTSDDDGDAGTTYPPCADELDAGTGDCPSVFGAKPPDTTDAIGEPAWTMTDEQRKAEQRPLAEAGAASPEQAKQGVVLAGPGKKELEWAKHETAQGVKAGTFDATVGVLTIPLELVDPDTANYLQSWRPKTSSGISQGVAQSTNLTLSLVISAVLSPAEAGGGGGGLKPPPGADFNPDTLVPAAKQIKANILAASEGTTAYVPKGTMVSVATGVVDGELRSVVTVSNTNAHLFLEHGIVPLPEGFELGPAPEFARIGGRNQLAYHVEVMGVGTLEDMGARGGFVGTSGLTCEMCSNAWYSGKYPTWIHTNWADYGGH